MKSSRRTRIDRLEVHGTDRRKRKVSGRFTRITKRICRRSTSGWALVKSYAADYRSKSLTDEKAKKLLDEWIALEQDEVKQRSAPMFRR